MAKPCLTLENVEGMTIAKKAHPQVVVIIPVTEDLNLIIAEQWRPAVRSNVIGFPAGHIGDDPGHEQENAIEAAKRELMEEAGYEGQFACLSSAASTPGMTDEITHFVLAYKLKKTGVGGGGEENIKTYEVPIRNINQFIFNKNNCIISAQMLAGLWAAKAALT